MISISDVIIQILSPQDLMVILVGFQVILIGFQLWILNKQRNISKGILDLEKRKYLPIIVVYPNKMGLKDAASRDSYPLKLENLSPFPAYNVRVERESNEEIIIGQINPKEIRDATLRRDFFLENGTRIRYLDPTGQEWEIEVYPRKEKLERLKVSPPRPS